MISSLKEKALSYYEKNETKVDIGFFLAGVVFDIFTLSDIDDPLSIAQQVIYLVLVGSLLMQDFLVSQNLALPPRWLSKIWNYRDAILHFFMGSLLSLYSLFFIKSSSFWSSFLFLGVMLGLMVANELKQVQKNVINLKVGLYFICLFSFFSMIYPVVLGFVGWTPFLLATATTLLALWLCWRHLTSKISDRKLLGLKVGAPGAGVILLFVVFYVFGWIPPVPLSVQDMGVYHKVEKSNGNFTVFHEKPVWKFWETGDQDFIAEPGDAIYFFAKIFSPGRFDDSVILHWQYKDIRQGWKTTDKVPMRVTGGRKGGYRGFATKQNYSPGDWRVKVETTDGREIGRFNFQVTTVETANPDRILIGENQ